MLSRFIEAWSDHSTRHAMLVHFPIVLSLVGLPFAVLAAWSRRYRVPALCTAIAVYVALCAAAGAAKLSGEDAAHAVEGALDTAGEATLESHETVGKRAWLFAGGVVILLAGGLVPVAAVRTYSPWVGVAGGLFVAGWIANVADYGGQLVYKHGAATHVIVPESETPSGDGGDAQEPSRDQRLVFFETQVRPILAQHCIRCHNPDRAKGAGGLDQTSIENLLVGGYSAEPAVVPGKPDESLLIAVMRHEVPDLEMPRGKDKLPDEQIALIAEWIAQGAVWSPIEWIKPPEQPTGD